MNTQYTLFSDSDFGYETKAEKQVVTTTEKVVEVKVAQSPSITASVLRALVDGGILEEGKNLEIEDIVASYASTHGVKLPYMAGIEEEREYDTQMDELRCKFEYAAEQIWEAMDNVHDYEEPHGYYSAAQYVEYVYYYYSVNTACSKENPLPYHEFMKACQSFTDMSVLPY